MTIAWRDGAAGVTSVTVPADVAAGDVALLIVSAASGTPSLSSAGTAPALIATVTDVHGEPFQLWGFTATGADAGAVITGPSGAVIALGAWSGASLPVDVEAGAFGSFTAFTAPSAVTATAGDWAVFLAALPVNSGLTITAPGAQRTPGSNQAVVADSNGPVGAAGTAIGGGNWTTNGGTVRWGGFTVGLAPAGGPPPSFSGTGDAAMALGASGPGASGRSGAAPAVVALGAGSSGSAARGGGGGAALVLRALAAGSSARSGTGAAALRLAALAATPAPPAAPSQGSWWGLISTLRQSRQDFDAYWSAPPVACPICGEPLKQAPSAKSGSGIELYCDFAGDHEFQFPRDWRPPVRPGGGAAVSPL